MNVTASDRFTASHPCPVCGGSEKDGRGRGTRCHGFAKNGHVFCARSEHAGKITQPNRAGLYRHQAKGPCPCGVVHAPDPNANGKPGGRKTIDKVYPYREADGKVLYEVVRYKPKDFKQRRPLGNGEYAWNLKGVERVLYNLPAILAADPSALVLIVEGEKDADNAGAKGLLATTCAEGAGKWRDSYSETIRGHPCAILPDNDEDGRKHAQKVAQSLRGKAASVKVVELPGVPPKGDLSDWLAAGGTVDQLLELVAKAPEWVPGAGQSADSRPQIAISHEEYKNVDDAVAALRAEPMLFQRGNALVTILAECRPKPRRHDPTRPPGSLRIALLPNAQIRRLLTMHARWTKLCKFSGNQYEVVPAHPPMAVIEQVATLGTWPGIRPVEGITETPTLRPDGSLISLPGYDEETGLWFAPSGNFPAIPDQPTLDDAKSAVEVLYDLVADFPFAGDPGKATWLAALLTPMARWAIDGPTPLFLFDSNCSGAGKTKLCDIIAILVTGRVMPRGAYPRDDDEMQKMLLSVTMAADRLILFDNVPTGFSIGGSALDRVLTARTMKGRVLGKSQMTPELPVDVVFFATGNNLGLRGDSLRRVIPDRLETTEERPEERKDFKINKECPCGCKGDLLAHTKGKRGELVAAALTIVRAFIVAGQPDQDLTPMDYPAWCGLIRNAVYWATGVDPCGGRRELIANDEETNAAQGLVIAWKALCEATDKQALSAAAALKILDDEKDRNPVTHPELRAILAGWSKDGRLPSALTIGHRLNKIRGRNINGKTLLFATSRGIREWYVRETSMHASGADGVDGAVENPSTRKISEISNLEDAVANRHGPPATAPSAPSTPLACMQPGEINHRDLDPNPF